MSPAPDRPEQDLLYSDVEEELRASVRALLAARADSARVLGRVEDEQPLDLDLWRALAVDLGATSLPIPEALGGQGAGLRETAVVAEELGRSVAPVPFLGSAVLATGALLHLLGQGAERGGPDAQAEAALTRLAEGAATAALVIPLSTYPGGPLPAVSADGDALTGTVRSVADAAVADLLVVLAGDALFLVEAAAARVTPVVSLDLTRPVADVVLDATPGVRLSGSGEAAVRAAVLVGAGILASEQVGIAEWCLTTTVAYLKERYQFGRPVGSFQSLKHRLADLWQELVLARAAARAAADALATGAEDLEITVLVAQSLCAAVALHAAEEAVQLHGGIGMTWEHPVHLYLKRAKADEIALGTPGRHRAALAPLVGLTA
ncbi:acyl-CoA dehydrogenase family protein [Actinokineospora spheciospongiae]|uniref:acyl-CoA dehydrogenase family protein n=1 Tax=Actinokineospora spheciospongiae TaxID=909613 RepID=UPI000D71C79C|nr:acyl-CoA dehydrogenase family protein [Actinokineospora spheciospongiae]PWW56833.1 alkylation response protein AidB-like acyl-CoA dehydrogenase [Actinokineospora spheciospongiae]